MNNVVKCQDSRLIVLGCIQIAYPSEAEDLRIQFLKVQANVAICAPMISQNVAPYCLEAGHEWVKNQVKTFSKNMELVMKALSTLGEDVQ